MRLAILLSSLLFAVPALGQSFNFRSTSSFVADNGSGIFIGQTTDYNATNGYGWIVRPGQCIDKSAAVDPRFSGNCGTQNITNGHAEFAVKVEPGAEYEIRAAYGTVFGSNDVGAELLDGSITFGKPFTGTQLNGSLLDAAGVNRLVADWQTHNEAVIHKFTSDRLVLRLGRIGGRPNGNWSMVSHLAIRKLSGPVTNQPPMVTLSVPPRLVLPGTLTLIAAATDDGIGGPLTYQWIVPTLIPANATVDLTSPKLDIANPPAGTHAVTVRVSDGTHTTEQSASVQVIAGAISQIQGMPIEATTRGAVRIELWIEGETHWIDAQTAPDGKTMADRVVLQWRQQETIPLGVYPLNILRCSVREPTDRATQCTTEVRMVEKR